MTKINIMYSIVKSHDVHVADDMAANVDRPDDVVLTWPMMWHWHDWWCGVDVAADVESCDDVDDNINIATHLWIGLF